MRIVEFGHDVGRAPGDERLRNVTIAPLTPPLASGASVQAACFRLGPASRIARHPASVPQIFAVVDGSGWISGEEGDERGIRAGEAVFWETGESHETRSDDGLTAIVIEGDGLRPFIDR